MPLPWPGAASVAFGRFVPVGQTVVDERARHAFKNEQTVPMLNLDASLALGAKGEDRNNLPCLFKRLPYRRADLHSRSLSFLRLNVNR